MMTDLMKWSPFHELMALGDQLERQLSQGSRPFPAARRVPSTEVVAREDGWRIGVALPGVAPENVEVNVTGQTVHIRAIKDVVKPRRIEISTEAQQQLSPAA